MLETILQSFSFIPHTASCLLITKLIGYDKKICLVEDHPRNTSVKVLSKYLQ